jgi:hypothetical protein
VLGVVASVQLIYLLKMPVDTSLKHRHEHVDHETVDADANEKARNDGTERPSHQRHQFIKTHLRFLLYGPEGTPW